ncbi:MAG: hypothetical protein JSV88_11480 [Candidatus Aminicenantes bacterium]|nr:MAG: hypothetical protein JSV88_11480 [Candidatus Aminicenantes bacterium]
MKDQKYRVIFRGEIAPQANPEEVKQNLAALYKVDIKKIDQLFSGKKFVLKENIDWEAAQEFAGQVEKAGARCTIVKMEEKDTGPIQLRQTTGLESKKTGPEEENIFMGYETRYRLMFNGEILHDKDINEVKTNLSMFYRVKPEKLAGLFTGKPVAVSKEPTDFWTAVSYLNRFKECGAHSYLEFVESPGFEPPQAAAGQYKIVFCGELQEGQDLLSVKTRLGSMFKVSGVVVDKLFLQRPVLVRTDLSEDAAQSFKKNFEKIGVRCQLLKVSEKPHPPVPEVSEPETEAAAGEQPAAPGPLPTPPQQLPEETAVSTIPSPPVTTKPADRQITYRPPPLAQKKSKAGPILIFIVIIAAVFIIFKLTSRQESVEPEPTTPQQTVTPQAESPKPTKPRKPKTRPKQKAWLPAGSGLLSDETKDFADPNGYFSVSLSKGYYIINNSQGKHTMIMFNYSPNINVTIIASPMKVKRDHQQAMMTRLADIQEGKAGLLSKLEVASYGLVSFNDLAGYEIFLGKGNQLVHVYEVVSPNNIAFSITIVTIGDNHQQNHDLLDSNIQASLRFQEQGPGETPDTGSQEPPEKENIQ